MTSPDEALLDRLQRSAFDYFSETELESGLVPDTTRAGSPVSIAVEGFALSAYPIAVEHGWMSRADAAARALRALRFFHDGAECHRGLYYHFLDARTGKRAWQCELSLIDSALLLAGALAAGVYFGGEIRAASDALYQRVDWRWARLDTGALAQGWKPECGFLHYGWEGYSEAILLYVLALGSPTHALDDDCYAAWTTTYQWEHLYGQDFLYAGPLFIHQFSHAWIDLEGIRDEFMREKRSDYFENTRRATWVQREYARCNPNEFRGYGNDCWGLSACDGPAPRGYCARGAPYGPDDGTLAPATIVGSLPFAPEIAMPALRHVVDELSPGKLPNGFNPTRDWMTDAYFGLDQGLVVLMIENHRTRLPWKLMRECPYVVAGLRRAGFEGGWLSHGAA